MPQSSSKERPLSGGSTSSRATSVSIRVISSMTRRIIGSSAASGGLSRCRQYSANPRTMLTDVRSSRLSSLSCSDISAADRRAVASAVRLASICSETLVSAVANAAGDDRVIWRSGRRTARVTATPATASSTSTAPAEPA